MISPPIDRVAPAPPPTDPNRDGLGEARSTKWLVIAGVGLPTLAILAIMMGFIGNVTLSSAFPFVSIDWEAPALFLANTPTGGDMGAHVLLPQYLRDNLLPAGRVFGWSNDWYAGYPALYFYFPLPALTTVLLDVFIPYGVAFKITTILGLVGLPAAVYFLVRSIGFARPVAAVATTAGSMYVFMESFSIFGGNVKSTLAGEYSFSWSFALSLVYLGLVIRDTRREGRPSPLAGVVLALTVLSHVVTTIVIVVVSLPLLFRGRGARVLVRSWVIGFALSAFWTIPFALRFFEGLNTDMGWQAVRGLVGDSFAPGVIATPLPNEFIPIFVLGTIGLVWTLLRRDHVAVLATMTVVPFVGFWILQLETTTWTLVYNARLLPYWYLGLHIFAGIAVGLAVLAVSRWMPHRTQNLAVGGAVAVFTLLTVLAVGLHDLPGWVRWNYTGVEGVCADSSEPSDTCTRTKPYDEFESLMLVISELPPGRVMWEANNELNKYGTPMALMLIPYWTDTHASMEGLYFESSLTTPFHFLNASEVSQRPSNPVRGLNYRRMDFERAEAHLALYDVSYYVSYTDAGKLGATEQGWEMLAETEPFAVFALPGSQLVDIATVEPSVWDGDEEFFEATLDYYDDVERLDQWVVMDGPEDWRRIDDIDERRSRPALPSGTVSDIVIEDHRLSFTTTAVGVPHLVKVSYFPNWRATGAEGPYRAAPSLMVIVPTEEEVVLEFVRTWDEYMGAALTVTALAGLGWWVRRRRHEDTPELVEAV